MEMDFLDWLVVDFSFRFGQFVEHPDTSVLDGFAEITVINDPADILEVPVMLMIMMIMVVMIVIVRISIKDNINFCSGDTFPLVPCYFQLITRKIQPAKLVNQGFGINSQVDHCPKVHIATNT
jgi:hypothetical protein